jgi:SAM-dependent methyltransferase
MNTTQWFSSDLQFHKLYADPLLAQASMHWTPLHIAKKAAEFLAAEPGKKILDIGSGAGKFCLAAAYYQPTCFYYGIEQRKNLVDAAHAAQDILRIQNAAFIHANISAFDLEEYDHFYFFNAFYENLDDEYKIDTELTYSKQLYNAYNRHLYKQLDKKPAGTRLATFHSTQHEIPGSYHEVGGTEDEVLKFWAKI